MVSGITGRGFPFTPLQMLWQPPGPTLQGRECSAVKGLGGLGQCIKPKLRRLGRLNRRLIWGFGELVG